MNYKDVVDLALRNLLRRRTRSILAILGVIIGTCSIVVMLSLGLGMSAGFDEQLKMIGDLHIINVMPGGGGPASAQVGASSSSKLDDIAIENISVIKGVTAITPILNVYLRVVAGKYVADFNVLGIKPEMMEKMGLKLAEGRLLKTGDTDALVFGKETINWFYNPYKPQQNNPSGKPPVDVLKTKLLMTGDHTYGEKIQSQPEGDKKVNYLEFKAKGIGILELVNGNSDYSVYMDLQAAEKIKKANNKAEGVIVNERSKQYEQVIAFIDDIGKIESISQKIKDMGFFVYNSGDWIRQMQNTSKMIQAVLGGIGAISLLVAALGITNTMVMSIYERTREIGVMKVLGASLKDIRNLFLIEAGVIGLIGGIIGALLSFIISLLMNTVFSSQLGGIFGNINPGMTGTSNVSLIPFWLVLASIAFSTMVGLLAGYYPARRAMRLSALEALRNE
ncbi:MAG: FtsX-like permease family protein [Clostridia bacterium]